jgi:nucleoid-associated protein Lsr2
VPCSRFVADAQEGTLPQLCYLWHNSPEDEHPPADVTVGMGAVQQAGFYGSGNPRYAEGGTMAQRVVTLLTDDIDGDEAAETVRFGVDGSEFEIDLNEENASAFREALWPYIQKGRRSGGRSTASAGRRAAAPNTKTDPAQLKAIRGWAKDQGLKGSLTVAASARTSCRPTKPRTDCRHTEAPCLPRGAGGFSL